MKVITDLSYLASLGMISLSPLEARWQHLTIRSKVNIISIIGVQLE